MTLFAPRGSTGPPPTDRPTEPHPARGRWKDGAARVQRGLRQLLRVERAPRERSLTHRAGLDAYRPARVRPRPAHAADKRRRARRRGQLHLRGHVSLGQINSHNCRTKRVRPA